MTTVLGIDPGLTRQNPTGLALLCENASDPVNAPKALIKHDRIVPVRSKTPWDAVVWDIARSLSLIVYSWGREIELIAYELPHVATNPQATIKLAHVCGIVVATACWYKIPVIGIQPSEAKKALTGKGNASKDEMIAAAQQQFGLSLPKDVADACGIALAGLAKYRKG